MMLTIRHVGTMWASPPNCLSSCSVTVHQARASGHQLLQTRTSTAQPRQRTHTVEGGALQVWPQSCQDEAACTSTASDGRHHANTVP